MKKILLTRFLLKIFLSSLLFLVFSRAALATHYAAADIHIDYIGTGPTDYTYRVTLNIYKACEMLGRDGEGKPIMNADLPPFVELHWKSSCFPLKSVEMEPPVIDTLDRLCDTFKSMNTCRDLNNSIFPAFVRHTFVDTVTLDGPCSDWVFWWTEPARNGGITNLLDPGGENIYVDAMINNSKKANINTPRYLVDPIPYYCIGARARFNNGPFDPDSDSMHSINIIPRDVDGRPIDYRNPPYSAVYPINTTPTDPYRVDATTCLATFSPTLNGKFVLAFRTSKYDWKTGELLAYTTRDVQISILGCEAPPPEPDSFPTGVYVDSATSTVAACPGQELRFHLGAASRSFVNAVFVRWDLSALPGATYTSTGDGTGRAVGTLNWTPGKEHVGDHVISLKFIDSTCTLGQPMLTESYYVLRIKVLPYVNGGKDGIYCVPGGTGWKMQTTVQSGMRYKWISIAGSGTTPPLMDDDTLARPTVRPAVNSTYVVLGSISYGPYRCSTRDTVNVRMGVPLISIDAGPQQTICANTPITLKASVSPGSSLGFVDWTPNYALSDTAVVSPTASPSVTTVYTLYAEDVNGCGFTDTTRVVVDGFTPLLDPFASRDTVCPEGSTQLYANVSLQPCGIAQSSCSGGTAGDMVVGTADIPSDMPSPFYHIPNSGGERMQLLYRKNELLDAGIRPGFINSLAFNIALKNTTDSFFKFTIKMACTPDHELSGNSMTSFSGVAEVYPAKTIGTVRGWNTFEFPNAYYWDGASNLMVEVCWSKVYSLPGGNPDPVFTSNTDYTSVKYVSSYTLPAPAMGDGCAVASPSITALLASNRPNTRFNVCSTPSLFRYSWTPLDFLANPDSANTAVSGIREHTTYNIKVTASSNPDCFSNGEVRLAVDRTNSVEALPESPYVVCRPGYVTVLDAEGRGPKPLQNIACGLTDPIDCGSATQDAIVADPTGTGSINAEANLHAFNGAHSTAHTQYIIPRRALLNGKMSSGTIRSIAIQSTGAASKNFDNLKISLKCTDLQQFPNITPVPLETGTVLVYNRSVTVGGDGYTGFDLDAPYNWDTTKNLLVDICYGGGTEGTGPTINNYATKGFYLMAKADQTTGDICANPGPQNGPFAYELLPNFRITFCSAGEEEFAYTWTPGEFMEDTTVKKPILYVGASTKVYVSTVGRNGCVVRDSVSLFVPRNKRYITRDTAICLNESINVRSYNGTKTVWYEGADLHKPATLSCDSCEVAIANPEVATEYYAAVTDEYDCVDTFRVHLDVKPLPTITIATPDTTIKYGGSVMLRAFGGTEYSWYPLAGLNMPNGVNPVAKPLVTTVYTVVGLGTNGCRSEDSVTVTVDYRAPLGIPNAFTPNGDGNNDIFRVAGASFQTLMEFRVFNRWGQELCSVRDIKGGWDGTYKGAAQDMGVYNYVIRIGYPDGKTETYKGDITLIR